VEIDMIVLFL